MKRLIPFITLASLVGVIHSCRNGKRADEHSIQSRTEISFEETIIAKDTLPKIVKKPFTLADESDLIRVIDTISGKYAYTIYFYNASEDSVIQKYYNHTPIDTLNFYNPELADKLLSIINNPPKSIYSKEKSMKDILRQHIINALDTNSVLPILKLRNSWTYPNDDYFIEFDLGDKKSIDLYISKSDSLFREIVYDLSIREAYKFESRRIALIVTDLTNNESDTTIISKDYLYDYCRKIDYYLNNGMALTSLHTAYVNLLNESDVIPFISNDTITLGTGMCVPDSDDSMEVVYRRWENGDTLWTVEYPDEGLTDIMD